jgi:hypothetical protein
MLSANTVAQNPCDKVMPPLSPGQEAADIIMGGGASAAGAVPAALTRPARPRIEKRFKD